MSPRASFLETYRYSGYGALVLAIVALRYSDPFFTMTLLAIASLTWTFKAAATRDELERAVVRQRRGPLVAASVAALVVGLHILAISVGV